MNDYSETQHFDSRVMAFIGGSSAIAFLGAFLAARSVDAGAVVTIAMGVSTIAIIAILAALKLETRVAETGVRVRGFWFINRLIPYETIASAEKRVYKPLTEYGGWGYRIGPFGKAYSARGNEGVQLVLKDGGRVLIGSQRADEFARALSARLGK